MIDWPTIKATASSLVADLSGLGADGVKWRDEPRQPQWGYRTMIYLRASSTRALGFEEEIRGDNGDDDQTVTVYGQRAFTLSVRCESSVIDIADPRHPENVLELLVTRLARTSTSERIHGVFAISTRESIAYVPYFEQGRQVNAYVLDLQCLTISADIDDTADAGGWIDEVQVGSSSIKDTDGSVLGTVTLDVDTGAPDSDP